MSLCSIRSFLPSLQFLYLKPMLFKILSSDILLPMNPAASHISTASFFAVGNSLQLYMLKIGYCSTFLWKWRFYLTHNSLYSLKADTTRLGCLLLTFGSVVNYCMSSIIHLLYLVPEIPVHITHQFTCLFMENLVFSYFFFFFHFQNSVNKIF